ILGNKIALERPNCPFRGVWGKAQQLNVFPRVDDLVSIVPADLLGNGTACLVWSSPPAMRGVRPGPSAAIHSAKIGRRCKVVYDMSGRPRERWNGLAARGEP